MAKGKKKQEGQKGQEEKIDDGEEDREEGFEEIGQEGAPRKSAKKSAKKAAPKKAAKKTAEEGSAKTSRKKAAPKKSGRRRPRRPSRRCAQARSRPRLELGRPGSGTGSGPTSWAMPQLSSSEPTPAEPRTSMSIRRPRLEPQLGLTGSVPARTGSVSERPQRSRVAAFRVCRCRLSASAAVRRRWMIRNSLRYAVGMPRWPTWYRGRREVQAKPPKLLFEGNTLPTTFRGIAKTPKKSADACVFCFTVALARPRLRAG